ncbi:uncharacterized protein GIQ15_00537 [Arthroderma uncinatum]|uniref:uncharacterized protein n=1 Tax=Arthroderma uncinatum TaxID=74035 RepID=UPI00144ACABC|nr:uncharacterized protein GIQ15_00537 [Arthroderma uncinatum]KAF3491020.1 hypothetical protein GIQ15_00537 [Arthroderma uncinatum]
MASTVAIPEGGTWLDTMRRSFKDVPIDEANDNAISTTEFLEAAESLVKLFDILGSVAFTPVKNDLTGNIKKIRDRQLAAPAESETLQALVLNELKTKQHKATEGLVWLIRGLDFTAQAFSKNLASETNEELAASFRDAYTNTLKPHHSFVVKPIFSAAMSATPYRKDFYAKLGKDESQTRAAMTAEIAALEKAVDILNKFLKRKEAQW